MTRRSKKEREAEAYREGWKAGASWACDGEPFMLLWDADALGLSRADVAMLKATQRGIRDGLLAAVKAGVR